MKKQEQNYYRITELERALVTFAPTLYFIDAEDLEIMHNTQFTIKLVGELETSTHVC